MSTSAALNQSTVWSAREQRARSRASSSPNLAPLWLPRSARERPRKSEERDAAQ